MKQWQLTHFGRQNLHLAEVAMPQPGPAEVLVKVAAVSLNYRDRILIDDGFGQGRAGDALTQTFTPGSDLVGEVVALGKGSSRFRTGTRVINTFAGGWNDGEWPGASAKVQTLGGLTGTGTLAEYVALPEDWLVAAPATLSDAQASTLSTAGLTAWFALVESAQLRAGQTVLVQGTGGVSLYAIQIAAAMGARVIVVSGSDSKLHQARALGAHDLINRSETPDWAEQVLALTEGRGVDHVLEMVGGDNLARSLRALAIGGTVSVIGFLDSFDSALPIGLMIQKRARLQGQMVGHRRALENLVRAIDRLELQPVVAAEYPQAELGAALNAFVGEPFGKIVVKMAACT